MIKKHVLHIVENCTVPLDKRVWSEALAAKEWGYDVSIICPNPKNEYASYERLDGIDIYRHPEFYEANKKHMYFFEYFNALFFQLILSWKIFLKKRFHIIHSANPPDNIFLIALIFKAFQVKYIFDHHDYCTGLYKVKFGQKDILYNILSLFETLSLKIADIVITTNESLKKIDLLKAEKDESDIFIVRNGPDLDKIKIKKPQKNYRDGHRFLIGYIGTISKQESIENLLRIVDYIVNDKKLRDIKFVIIGTGPNIKEYMTLTKEMNLSNYIEFTGFIPFEELLGILQQCDIGVNPEHTNSYTDKSTMLKIMDYMLAGKPIIQFESSEGQFTAGQASMYIKNNDEVEFANQLVELLHNQPKQEEMGKIGKKRVAELLNWKIQKENLKDAYTYLMDMHDIGEVEKAML